MTDIPDDALTEYAALMHALGALENNARAEATALEMAAGISRVSTFAALMRAVAILAETFPPEGIPDFVGEMLPEGSQGPHDVPRASFTRGDAITELHGQLDVLRALFLSDNQLQRWIGDGR